MHFGVYGFRAGIMGILGFFFEFAGIMGTGYTGAVIRTPAGE